MADPWGRTIFDPRDIIWANLVQDHKAMLHTKYQSSRPHGFGQEDFLKIFPYITVCKMADPWGGAIFDPRDKIWANLVEDHMVMLHIKYQSSRPFAVFDKNIFEDFPYITLCKMADPWGSTIFDPRDLIWANLVEDHKVMLHTKYRKL